jgi:hypothetical protein
VFHTFVPSSGCLVYFQTSSQMRPLLPSQVGAGGVGVGGGGCLGGGGGVGEAVRESYLQQRQHIGEGFAATGRCRATDVPRSQQSGTDIRIDDRTHQAHLNCRQRTED